MNISQKVMEFRLFINVDCSTFEKNVLITFSFDTQSHWQSTYSCKIFYMQKVRNPQHPVLLRSDRCGDGHFYIRLQSHVTLETWSWKVMEKSWNFISRSLWEPVKHWIYVSCLLGLLQN